MIRRIWLTLPLRTKGLAVVLVPALSLFIFLSALFWSDRQEQESDAWVIHTLEVRSNIQRVYRAIDQSKTHLRGYLLTRARAAANQPVPPEVLAHHLNQLRNSVSDNPQQLLRLNRITSLLATKQANLNQLVALPRESLPKDTVEQVIEQSCDLLDQAQSQLDAMHASEEKHAIARLARTEQSRALLHIWVMFGLVAGIASGVLASLIFTQGIDRRIHDLEAVAGALVEGDLPAQRSATGVDTITSLEYALDSARAMLTERENKLHEANHYLNHLLASTPGVLTRLDVKTHRFLYVGPSVKNVLGYSPDQMLGNPDFYSQTLHPDDHERVQRELALGLAERIPVIEIERRILHHDGHYIWIHSYARCEYDDAKNVTSLLIYSYDVTQRRAIEDAQRENEERFRNSFDFAPIGIALVSLDGQWRRVNRALCEILGYGENELLLTPLKSLIHPEDADVEADLRQQLLDSQERSVQAECRYLHRQGYVVWTQVGVSLVRDIAGRPLYFISQFQDISDRRRIELELSQAYEAALESVSVKANFMANMSHEIRTPMNGIIGMIDLLHATELSALQLDFLGTMRDSADSLLVIINDILDFSKIEAGKMPLETSQFDLSATVESVAGLLAPKSHERGIELATLIYRDVPTKLCGDAVRVRQVLLNLLGNAIKFTEQGEVTLRVTRENESDTHVTLCFSVRDSGIGIDDKTQEFLFQPFAQADATTTRRYGGTGLGLAISKQLVELMGGQIGARSKVGKGSTFWFTATFEKQSVVPSLPDELSSFDLRVLVVEENDDHRGLVQQQIASWNFHTEGSKTGTEALELLHREFRGGEPYQIVMIDDRISDIDSLALVRSIRAQSAIAGTRIIVMVAPHDDIKAILAAGADMCLAKPIRQSQLFDVLSQVMVTHNVMPTAPNPPALPVPSNSPSLRILVAEDNEVNQKVVHHQLKNMGHEVMLVDNGHAVLDVWRSEAFDLILMDCHMPFLDGYATTREIRREETAGEHIPIIALTANALQGDREKCIAAGMDDHLSKPLKRGDLAAAIARWTVVSEPEGAVESSLLESDRWKELETELGVELLRDLADLFMKETPQQLADMRQNFREGDESAALHMVHKIKSSCATLGATRMAQLCVEIEENADLEADSPLIESLMREFVAVCEALQKFLSG